MLHLLVSFHGMTRFFSLFFLLSISCQQQTQIPPPQNINDLLATVHTPEIKICALDVSQIENGDTGVILKALGSDFASPNSLSYESLQDGPSALQTYSRQNALRRRLLAGTEGNKYASGYYTTLPFKGEAPATLPDFTDRMAHWWEKVGEQQDREDTESPDYNIRFCVINEERGHDAFEARAYLLQTISDGKELSIEVVNQYFNQDRIPPHEFKTDVIERLIETGHITPLDKARLRAHETAIFRSDPKTAESFWTERDAEIDAMHDHIDSHAYATLADKLLDMRNIDQSLRGLWNWSRHNDEGAHFATPNDRKNFEAGISTRIRKVDHFNTQHLKSMLEGRGWFNDETDGEGAARRGWLIAQHADRDPDFQEHALTLMEDVLDKPSTSKSNYAYLMDRVLVKRTQGDTYNADNIRQRYGTQGRCTKDGWKPLPLENPDNIDALRASVGLGTLADYVKRINCGNRSDK